MDGAHSGVRAHVCHVTVKEVETHKGGREEAQSQEVEKFQEERHEQQVTLLRKPSPATVPLFQCIGKG